MNMHISKKNKEQIMPDSVGIDIGDTNLSPPSECTAHFMRTIFTA